MSEQDRVDTPEDDEVEAHKRRMTDDSDAGIESDDFEAHKHHPSAAEDPDSSDADDFEAHKRHPSAAEDPDADDADDFEAHKRHTL